MAALGSTYEEKHLHNMIATEKKEKDLRLRRLCPLQRGSGARKLNLEETPHTAQGEELRAREINLKE